MATEREVAGIRCSEVLEELSDFLDGELAAKRREQIVAHLEGCTWCAQLGGEVGATVRALRSRLGEAPAPNPGTSARIRQQLRELARQGQ